MAGPVIGELCAGYGGLAAAVTAVFGGELAWVADNDPGAAAILAHRFPGVPNLGDITKVDWAAVEPVDIMTAGFPCQDVSCAGARRGLRKGTRTGVWAHVAAAVAVLRPALVVLENVGGLLSQGADSDVEPCPWCLGDTGDERAVRALGAVLADLAEAGFDAEWACVRAADVGAPHRRERVFVLAWPADADGGRWGAEPGNDGRRGRGRIRAEGLGSQPAADTGGGELQRRGRPGVLGGAPAAAPGQEVQREWAGHAAGDRGAVAADPDRAARDQRGESATGQAEGGGAWADAGRRGGTPAADTGRGDGLGGPGSCGPGAGAAIGREEVDQADRCGAPQTPADAAAGGGPARLPEPAPVGGRHDADRGNPGAGPRPGPDRQPRAGVQAAADAQAADPRGRCGSGPAGAQARPGQSGGAFAESDDGGVGSAADAERDGLQGQQRVTAAATGREEPAAGGCGPTRGGGAAADAERGTGGGRADEPLGGPDRGAAAAGDRPADDGGGAAAADTERDTRTADVADRAAAARDRHAAADPDGDGRAFLQRPEPGLGPRDDPDRRSPVNWGTYGPAIARWEAVTGRAAPRPTEPGRTGERLAPRFVEWMMGLPEGHVTGVPGLSRNAQLKALGNGVVPQQAAAALLLLLDRVAAEAA